ncbi:MAG TPA: class I SAM-dependent methyltransferase [Anaerolineaceae bacterium]|nr:class I SAM-dependent methyltransferase [Anaerolineaceae bacterium]HQN05288.1 class I SAM-dependent methyltransferase [Anaerolineaceae bacterium]HQP08235.1 class I SAM-dependent methyltransferase [Anaerolineaceae bacterium]
MYNTFSDDYDRFVNWKNRLAFEMPFIEKTVSQARRETANPAVLDAACGTGMHAIALAKLGFSVSGADLFPEMIARAKENAAREGVNVHFEPAGFGSLEKTFGSGKMDALLCLGNSLPHVEGPAGLESTVRDFAAVLRLGGILLLQSRNFDKVMQEKMRWMDPQAHHEEEKEWIFIRFYDFDPDGYIQFNILTLYREDAGGWQQTLRTTTLYPVLQADLEPVLQQAGFKDIRLYGSMDGADYDRTRSENLIVTAVKY